jgi:hypothetical protein
MALRKPRWVDSGGEHSYNGRHRASGNSQYVRRKLAQDAAVSGSPVSTGDLARFASTFGDLADPDVMSQAWQ